MTTPQDLMVGVWREACRHADLAETAAAIREVVRPAMPIARLVIAEFSAGLDELTLRAGAEPVFPAGGRRLGPAERRDLQRWARSAEVVDLSEGTGPSGVAALFSRLLEPGAWLAGPLLHDRTLAGALLISPADRRHLDLFRLLLEPFAVALGNDTRLHELARLREAAEADKRSALARLGRVDLGDTIVGVDGGLRSVMERAVLAARSDIPVLLLGETGTGKEVIARAIHERSPRSDQPFIRVNCGAIPPDLLDSHLFGHEKGAFTGALARRQGWFERADRGTLLLDEIGELPPPAQVRLLRVLQEGTLERVGGEGLVRVDVRIIAATHRDLPTMIQQGLFRADLWYRISGFPIVLPPLRERRQDIPALATHLAERAARRFGLRERVPSADDLQLLAGYDWPGNIRELASVVDRAAILGDGQRLEIRRALGWLPSAPPPDLPTLATTGGAGVGGRPGSLDSVVRAHIEAVLAVSGGRIEGARGAARTLGVNPHTLRARMRKLGIDWARFRSSIPGADPSGGR